MSATTNQSSLPHSDGCAGTGKTFYAYVEALFQTETGGLNGPLSQMQADSLILIGCLDRLRWAGFDADDIVRDYAGVSAALAASTQRTASYNGEMNAGRERLERVLGQQTELGGQLAEDDATSADFPRVARLGADFLPGIIEARLALDELGVESGNFIAAVQQLAASLGKLGDCLYYMALRYFQDALLKGQDNTLTALCLCCDLIRESARQLGLAASPYACPAAFGEHLAAPFVAEAFPAALAYSLGDGFDTWAFDDDSKSLHGDVAEYLYGGNNG